MRAVILVLGVVGGCGGARTAAVVTSPDDVDSAEVVEGAEPEPSAEVEPAHTEPEPASAPEPETPAEPEAVAHRPLPASTMCPPTMGEIAAARFEMGANEGDFNMVAPVMQPRVEARVEAAFCLDQTEVTTQAYEECVEAGACTPALDVPGCNTGVAGREQHPINCVDWFQAEAYCAYRGARLPTEPEWELAARGTEGRIYPWGDTDPLGNDALYYWSPGEEWTLAVGQRPAADTPTGLQDMGGNVWEWTRSRGCMHGTRKCTSRDRVIKGGGIENTFSVPAANRFFSPPEGKQPHVGFRCAGPRKKGRAAKKPKRLSKRQTLHWSMLSPRVEIEPVVPTGITLSERVVCMVRVEIDARGEPTAAKGKVKGACTRALADVAEATAMHGRWWPTFGERGAASEIPVRLDPPGA